MSTSLLSQPMPQVIAPQPPRRLDPMGLVIRVRHYSSRTEACCLPGVR